MNEKLIEYYVEGMLRGYFEPESNTGSLSDVSWETPMKRLESKLRRDQGMGRKENPEWAEALKVFKSPLMEALK